MPLYPMTSLIYLRNNMRLLLDTHIFIWYIQGNPRLSKMVQSKIAQAVEVYVSSASIWEIAIKVSLKKLNIKIERIVEAIAESDFLELPVSMHHASFISQLPHIHSDPFDRLLIAQAMTEPLTFLTADSNLKEYSELVEVLD